MFSGHYKRSGNDLTITGDDGQKVVVPDYFKLDKRPTLLSPEGAVITGDIVDALAGPAHPGQYAQVSAPVSDAAKPIGKVEKLTGSATVIRNGVAVELNVGDHVLKGDVLQTGSASSITIGFIDGTVFNLSASSRMVLSEMIYDPNGSANAFLVNVLQGSFTFLAGQVAKTGDMKIATPVAIMGVRSTSCGGELVEITLSDGTVVTSLNASVNREPNDIVGTCYLFLGDNPDPITVSDDGKVTIITPTLTGPQVTQIDKPLAQQLADQALVLQLAQIQGIILQQQTTPQSGSPNSPPVPDQPKLESPPPPPPDPDKKTDLPPVDINPIVFVETDGPPPPPPPPLIVNTTGSVIEDDVNPAPILADSGALDFTPTTSAVLSDPIWSDGTLSSVLSEVTELTDGFTVSASGWNYTIDNALVQFLAENETITFSFTVTDGSGNSEVVTFTIVGNNDAPVILAGDAITRIAVPASILVPPGVPGTDPLAKHAIAPDISADGRYVVFFSTVELPEDGNNNNNDDGPRGDVFLYDRLLNTTTILTDNFHIPDRPPGEAYTGFSISDDGRIVVFKGEHDALNVPGQPQFGTHDESVIYVYDRDTGLTTPLTNPDNANQPYHINDLPRVGGQLIVFTSFNFSGPGNVSHVIVTDLDGNIVTDVTVADLGTDPLPESNFRLEGASISDNGRYLTFWKVAVDPITFNTTGEADLYIYDRDDGSYDEIAHTNVENDEDTWWASMSSDGRFVVFQSNADDLVPGDNNDALDIFVYDQNTGLTERVSVGGTALAEIQANGDSIRPNISPDGRYIIFSSIATNLVPGDTNLKPDTFVYDRLTHTIERVSVDATGIEGDGDSSFASAISGGGIFAAFAGTAANLVPVDANGATSDVFVVDTSGGTAGIVIEDVSFSDSDPNFLATGGTFAFTDPDLSDAHTVIFSFVGATGAPVGFVIPAGVFAASVVENTADVSLIGNVVWTFAVLNADVQGLGAHEFVTLTYSLLLNDGNGGSAPQTVTVALAGINDAPVLTVDTSGAVEEDATNPNLTDTGTLSFTDVDFTDTHTTSAVLLSGPTWSNGTLSSVLTGAQIAALTAGFTVDANSWDYTVANSLVQFLAEGETITFSYTVTVTDDSGTGNNSDSEVVTVTITGNNDAPVLTVDTTGGVTEDASDPSLTDTGTLSFTDIDFTDTHTTGAALLSGPTWSNGTLSSVLTPDEIAALTSGFTVDANSWDYTVANSLVQFLAEGETITFSFTVTVEDDSGEANDFDSETVTVTITGNNDAPVLTVDTSGAVTEDATDPTLTDSGTLSFTDVDLTDTHTTSKTLLSAPTWNGGDISTVLSAAQIAALTSGFTVDLNSWDYTVANALVQFLAEGETITFSFTVTVTDDSGTGNASDSEVVTVIITGTNDAPVIAGEVFTGGVTEKGSNVDTGTITDSDTFTFDDLDLTDAHTIGFVPVGTPLGTLTALTISDSATGAGNGTVSWTYTVDAAAVAYLAEDETKVEEFTVTVTDDATGALTDTATVKVTITGTNDAPVITGTAVSANKTETDTTLTATGTLNVVDVDLSDTVTMTVYSVAVDESSTFGGANPLTLAALKAMMAVSPTTALNADPSAGSDFIWTFTSGASGDGAFNFLDAGETLILLYTLKGTDDSGVVLNDSDTQIVTITITGTADVPPPIATGETIYVNNDPVDIPEWLLLLNDTNGAIDVTNVVQNTAGGDTASHTEGGDGTGFVTFNDGDASPPFDGGSFTYQAVNLSSVTSGVVTATINNQSGSSTITGDANANVLFGAAGNDTLLGDADNDTYVFRASGDGNDTINDSGGTADRIVIGTLGAALTQLNFERDNFDGSGVGDGDNDDLRISYNDQTITVLNHYGADNTAGGAGKVEQITFLGGATYLGYSIASGPYTLNSIRNSDTNILDGTAGNDIIADRQGGRTLNGGDGNDLLFGNGDDDTLNGGSGADLLVGGSGNDTADYSTSGSGVTVNLGAGTASGGDAAGDVLSEIENLTGSGLADTLTGDTGANILIGGGGADILTGGGGNDDFRWNATNEFGDVITDFAPGSDDFVFDVGASAINIGNNNNSVDYNEGTDAIINVAGNEVNVKTDAGFANAAAIQTAINGYNSITTGAVFVVFNTAVGNAQVWYDPDGGGDASSAVLVADLNSFTTVGSLSGLSSVDFVFV